MREIKFRAWDKKGKGFIAGFNMYNFHSYFNKGSEPSIHRYSTEWKLSDIELMQYTGLKDKNGKEIYEGDIVIQYEHADYKTEPMPIAWVGNDCGWWMFRKGDPHLTLASWRDDIKIIGNIYENPELLKPETAKET